MNDRFARLRLGRLVLWPLGAIALLGLVIVAGPGRVAMPLTAGAYLLYLAMLLAAVRSGGLAGITPAEVMGPMPSEGRPWKHAVTLAPLLLIFSAMCAWLTVIAAGSIAPEWAAEQLLKRDGPGLLDRFGRAEKILLAILITLVGPFVEEYVFRGLLLRKWAAKYGVLAGLLGSAALFAVLHPHMSVGAFAFGVVLGVLYLWSGSLLPPVLIHVLNNGLVTMASLSGDQSRPSQSSAEAMTALQAQWAIPLTVALVAGAAIVSLTWPLLRQVRERYQNI